MRQSGHLNIDSGLGLLTGKGAYSHQAIPALTTLTAPSHISTITCSSPIKHGIVANHYYENGRKVSGFEKAFKTEPFWQAALRARKRVLSLAYVGSNGTSPRRTVTDGLAYPDSKLIANHQVIELDWNELRPIDDHRKKLRQKDQGFRLERRLHTFEINLNPQTNEKRLIYLTVDKIAPDDFKLIVDDDQNLENGSFGKLYSDVTGHKIVDVFFTEQHRDSSLRGRLRRAWLRLLPSEQPNRLKVYVSKASYNNAYPPSFARFLEERKMVWPDYGIREPGLPLMEKLAAQAMIDQFLAHVGELAQQENNYDLVLFYQPLIDSLGHSYQRDLPEPFQPDSQDQITRLFVKGFQIIDANLKKLISSRPAKGVVAIVGDHGMDPSIKAVNLTAISDSDSQNHLIIEANGGLALIYPSKSASEGEALQATLSLKQKLDQLTYHDLPVISHFMMRQTYRENYDSEYYPEFKQWPYGEAIAAISSGKGFWFKFDFSTDEILLDPPALGMHGQFHTIDTMTTGAFFYSPRIQRQNLGPIRLIDVIPSFAKLTGLPKPKDCQGKSLEILTSESQLIPK